MNSKIYVVSTTFPTLEQAQCAATELTNKKVAACVQISKPIESTYIWQNKIFTEEEIKISIKTSISSLEKLKLELKNIHPYECPEFIAICAEASQEYADWINSVCK